MEHIEVPLERRFVKVKLGEKVFVLRELDCLQRENYLKALHSAPKFPDQTISGQGLSSLFLGMSMVDEAGTPVPRETVEAWPARVSETLMELAGQHNLIGAAEELAKKA